MERQIGTPRGRKGMVSENGTQQGEATKRNYKRGCCRYKRNFTGYARNRQMNPRTEQLAMERGTRNDVAADADAVADYEAKRQKSDETLKWQKASGPSCACRVGCLAI